MNPNIDPTSNKSSSSEQEPIVNPVPVPEALSSITPQEVSEPNDIAASMHQSPVSSGQNLDNIRSAQTPIGGNGVRKSRFWVIYSWTLFLLTALPLLAVITIYANLIQMAKNGASGTEFVALALYPVLLVILVLFFIDLVSSIIYLLRRKPSGRKLILPITAVLISLLAVGYGAYAVYSNVLAYRSLSKTADNRPAGYSISNSEAVSLIQGCKVQSLFTNVGTKSYPGLLDIKNQDKNVSISANDLASVTAMVKSYSNQCGGIEILKVTAGLSTVSPVTVAEATELLNSCKLTQFSLPGLSSDKEQVIADAFKVTGIIVEKDLGSTPFGIRITDSQKSVMVPIARSAGKKCPAIRFWAGPSLQWQNKI